MLRALLLMSRGVTRRCARCGQGRLFRRWFTLRERCPGCGMLFEREEGYWVGAVAINTGAVQLALGVVLVGGLVWYWPDVPWTALLIACLAVAGSTPLLFYPFSKTIWMAIDALMHTMDSSPPDGADDDRRSANGDAPRGR